MAAAAARRPYEQTRSSYDLRLRIGCSTRDLAIAQRKGENQCGNLVGEFDK